jgi:hemerythrin-like domain-containing protein
MINTTDPVALLKNEHKALLGQLGILERAEGDREEIALILKTLIRDCTVHFRREALLFDELDTKLSPGGRSLHPLIKEHRDLKRHATNLLKEVTRREESSQFLKSMRLQLCELATQFRAHIQHEEKVVFLLARTRLTEKVRLNITKKMLVK